MLIIQIHKNDSFNLPKNITGQVGEIPLLSLIYKHIGLPVCTVMKIDIGKGYFAIIDKKDFELIKPYKWFVKETHGIFYAVAYLKKIKRKTFFIRMHRLIMGVTDPKILIDHKNHNGLDNRRNNLRECTNSENLRNRKGSNKNSKSKYLGVGSKLVIRTLKKTGQKVSYQYWVAKIQKGKSIYLGTFKNEIDAAKAYDQEAIKHFGEFANLNFK